MRPLGLLRARRVIKKPGKSSINNATYFLHLLTCCQILLFMFKAECYQLFTLRLFSLKPESPLIPSHPKQREIVLCCGKIKMKENVFKNFYAAIYNTAYTKLKFTKMCGNQKYYHANSGSLHRLMKTIFFSSV